jgi:hypothetical protein
MTGNDWVRIVATLYRHRGCTECWGTGRVMHDDRPYYDGLELFAPVMVCLRCRGYGGDFPAFLHRLP